MKQIVCVALFLAMATLLGGCATPAGKVANIKEIEDQLKKEWQTEQNQPLNIQQDGTTAKAVEGAIDVGLGLAWGATALLNPLTAIDAIQGVYMAFGVLDGTANLSTAAQAQAQNMAILWLNFNHDVILAKQVGSEKYQLADIVKSIFDSKKIVLKHSFDLNITNTPEKTKVYEDSTGNKIQVTRQLKLTAKCKHPDSGCTKKDAEETAFDLAKILSKRLLELTLK